jgi:hypothetical protein
VWFHIKSAGGGWDAYQMDPVPVVYPPCKWFYYNYTLTANTDYEYYFSSGGSNYPAGNEDCPYFTLCVDDGCDQEPCPAK